MGWSLHAAPENQPEEWQIDLGYGWPIKYALDALQLPNTSGTSLSYFYDVLKENLAKRDILKFAKSYNEYRIKNGIVCRAQTINLETIVEDLRSMLSKIEQVPYREKKWILIASF